MKRKPHEGMAFRRIVPESSVGHWKLMHWTPDGKFERYAGRIAVHGESCDAWFNTITGLIHAQVRGSSAARR